MRFPLAAIILVFVAAMCFLTFFMWDYVLFNSDTGVSTRLAEQADKSFNPRMKTWYNELSSHLRTGLGLIGVVLLGIAFFLFMFTSYQDIKREI